MSSNDNWIVFSDLDGTLFDAQDYSFSEAQAGLDLLHTKKISLIPCTSKTYKEVLEIRQKLHLETPFIVENGSAVLLPKESFADLDKDVLSQDNYNVYILGKPYREVVEFLNELKLRFRLKVKGFSEMSLQEIREHTNLDKDNATLAAERMFSEPFIAEEKITNFNEVKDFAEEHGFRLLRGNRFYHLLGQTDKGRAVKKTLDVYRSSGRQKLKSMGLGDSPNDLEMFQNVDQAVLIKRPSGEYAELGNIKNMFYSNNIGPAGWSEAVLHFIR